MTPSDIIVGKYYKRMDYSGALWLGCGKRKPFTYGDEIEFSEKYLVCVRSPENCHHVGLIFKTPEDHFGSTQEDWDLFYLAE